MKNYNEFINENFKDLLKGKSDKDVEKQLSGLDIFNRIDKIRHYKLSNEFMPSDEEIQKELDTNPVFDKIDIIDNFKLDSKFIPSNKEMEEGLKDLDPLDRIKKIKLYDLSEEYIPTNDQLMDELNFYDDTKKIINDVINNNDNLSYQFILFLSKFRDRFKTYLEYENYIEDKAWRMAETNGVTHNQWLTYTHEDKMEHLSKHNLLYSLLNDINSWMNMKSSGMDEKTFQKIFFDFIEKLKTTNWYYPDHVKRKRDKDNTVASIMISLSYVDESINDIIYLEDIDKINNLKNEIKTFEEKLKNMIN